MDMATMTLSKTEREILQHRLDCPDCIAEVMTDNGYAGDAVDAAVEKLTRQFDAGLVVAFDAGVEAEVLAELIEGSTWHCAFRNRYDDGLISKSTLNRAYGKVHALAAKLSAVVGRRVLTPGDCC
jgi:hypothetical protein